MDWSIDEKIDLKSLGFTQDDYGVWEKADGDRVEYVEEGVDETLSWSLVVDGQIISNKEFEGYEFQKLISFLKTKSAVREEKEEPKKKKKEKVEINIHKKEDVDKMMKKWDKDMERDHEKVTKEDIDKFATAEEKAFLK